jgi:hypothetical protein
VPIIFFTTGLHRDYHYVTDEVDKIEFPKMAKIAALVYGTAARVANLDHPPQPDNLGALTSSSTRTSIFRSSTPTSRGRCGI